MLWYEYSLSDGRGPMRATMDIALIMANVPWISQFINFVIVKIENLISLLGMGM